MRELIEEFTSVECVFRKYSLGTVFISIPENKPLFDELWKLFVAFNEQSKRQPISFLRLYQYIVFITNRVLTIQKKEDITRQLEFFITTPEIISCAETMYDICQKSQMCENILKEIHGQFLIMCRIAVEQPLCEIEKREFLLQYKSEVNALTEKAKIERQKPRAVKRKDEIYAFCARYRIPAV